MFQNHVLIRYASLIGPAWFFSSFLIFYVGFSDAEAQASVFLAFASGSLAYYYFVQQQKLERIRLFKDLFEAFNSRYAQFNAELERISQSGLKEGDRDKLIDYFNLCAEEYLYFKENFIPPIVWKSWCLGIIHWLKHQEIRVVWNEEVKTESHYGMTIEAIESGANLQVK